MEEAGEVWLETTQMLLLGTGTSEVYINRLLLPTDPFGAESLLDPAVSLKTTLLLLMNHF
jgi:hypothetical protein